MNAFQGDCDCSGCRNRRMQGFPGSHDATARSCEHAYRASQASLSVQEAVGVSVSPPRPTDDVASPAFDVSSRLRGCLVEIEKGKALLADLDRQRSTVTAGMAKLEGAIELLREMGAKE